MPRKMSFAMTTEQFKNKTKTVTRRFGWWFLKPGDIVEGVEKSMGLKKGEKVKSLGLIEILSTRAEPLNAISQDDVIREGFPHFTPAQFVEMLVSHSSVAPDAIVNRIEFKHLPKKYQPANGTEGISFMEVFCDNCVHDRFHQENPDEPGCSILTAAMVFDVDEPEYPEEWVYGNNGLPLCRAFQADGSENTAYIMGKREEKGQLRLF